MANINTSRLLFLVASVTATASFGQTVINMPDVKQRPTMAAVPLQKDMVVDGVVIDDPVWEAVPAMDQMVQQKPNAGFPASEKTLVRIGYSATTLYVAVVCYDKEPGRLVVSDARRDATLDNTDSFLLILDTYHDQQNGFVFGTNPIGVEYDGQVDNEGQGNFSQNRQQQGVIGGFNLNWDAAFTVKSIVGDFGWSAEFAIPLRTLRFASGSNQTWGLNFQRNIRKTNEIAYWAALPIQFDIKRLSLEGTLTGLSLQSPGNLKFIPYVLGRGTKDFNAVPSEPASGEPAVGADIKFSVTSAVTLDLTYNTDFAQVEVDQQQINLDRFNLFFPEKRPFFLENAGQFTVGSPGEVDLFFSRRIGIGPNGEVVPIIGGARLSGKIDNTNIGFLSMYTDGLSEIGLERNNFSVARINQQLAQRSSVGGIFVSRLGMESPDDYNRTYGVDGKWGIGKKATISGYYAKTDSPQDSLNNQSFKLSGNYEWNGVRANLAYTEVGEGFNPEVGYLFRSGFRKPEALIFKQVRMNGKYGMLELRPHVSYRSYWNYNNFLETSFLHVDNHWVWVNGLEIHTGINFTTEGVVNPFMISGVTVDPGTYNHEEAQLVLMTNASKMFYVNTRSILGGSFGGTRYVNTGTLGFRLGDRFNSEYSVALNDLRLPNGDAFSTLFAARLSYSFTPRVNFQAFAQYNSTSKLWSFNLRFSLLEQANTGLFVVYNDIYTNGLPNNRSFTVKYTRMFDLMGGRGK